MGQTVLSLIPIFECLKQTKKYFLKEPLKRKICQTVLSFDQNLLETLENPKLKRLMQIEKQSLY